MHHSLDTADAGSRRRWTALAAAGLLAALLAVLMVPVSAQAAARPADATVVQRILTDTNRIRASHGLGPLKLNAAISSVATAWSGQQANANAMTHNPDFSSQIPSGWSRAGENVAKGYDPSATSNGYIAVVDGWRLSSGHLANMLGDYTDIGIGIAYSSSTGYAYYTQNFGKYGASVPRIQASSLPAPGTTLASGAVPVYRFWSPVYQGHFFTASLSERNSVITSYPGVWKYEKVAYYAFTTQQPGTVPVFRFWSASKNSHFYTADPAQRDAVIRLYKGIWSYEKIAYYVYPASSTVAGTSTIYRFWSDAYQHHFYTASASEKATIQRTYPARIWKYETVAFRTPTT